MEKVVLTPLIFWPAGGGARGGAGPFKTGSFFGHSLSPISGLVTCSSSSTMDDDLKEAITFGDLESAEELLVSGVASHHEDDEVGSPLHLAASLNEGKMVGLLLKYGAKVNYVNPADGNSALHSACASLSCFSPGNIV